MRLTHLLSLSLCVYAVSAAFASTTYTDQATFFAATGAKITDGYTNPGYVFLQSDAQMSSVLGETRYQTTTFSNWDIVSYAGSLGLTPYYCGGCNGGFNLFFTSTSVGSSTGVYGVGFFVAGTNSQLGVYDLITYGDGSTQMIPLPIDLGNFTHYFGVTSSKSIAEMQMVDPNGNVPPMNGWSLAITDLTIAASPEPTTLLLLGSSIVGGIATLRRKTR